MKDGSLRAADIKKGQLPTGPQGAAGPRGLPGATGADGPAGPGAVAIDLSPVNGANSAQVVLGEDLVFAVDCTGSAGQRRLYVGVGGTEQGDVQWTFVRSRDDAGASADIRPGGMALFLGPTVFGGIGYGQPDGTSTTGHYFRLHGSFVAQTPSGTTSVVLDALLDDRGTPGCARSRALRHPQAERPA